MAGAETKKDLGLPGGFRRLCRCPVFDSTNVV